MAITALEYLVCRTLRANHFLPAHPRVVEFGESNWYADVPMSELVRDVTSDGLPPETQSKLLEQIRRETENGRVPDLYNIARLFFKTMFDYSNYTSIDLGTRNATYHYDLNQPVPLTDQFDVLLNFGTGEHIFNVYQFYKTAHELTAPGGIMIHTAPFAGWFDHGFFNFQPTFFFDLAAANQYHVMSVVVGCISPFQVIQISNREQIPELVKSGKIPANANINVVMQQSRTQEPFRVPQQGYYAQSLSPAGMKAWQELR